ncbi:hypothetical protein HPP92_016466 [Vanilla planifolia]|uniref:Heparanase-like protein 3 n=1 Tax=Vanilla planifolia TaxID=51239 RepID=A0A835QEV6_VANPL|nr:hypothetical protein HPP92_016466 [Vanilla planifolia]
MAITVLPPLALRLLAVLLVFSAASLPAQTEGAYEVTLVTTVVDGEAVVSETDGHFVCATLDWRSAGMCRCGSCTWNHASILNLNLSTRVLLNAVKEFSPLKLRLGGSLEDMVTYQTDPDQICNPFVANASAYFGYSDGCLSLARWDELHEFFNKTGAAAVFGLNALNGRITLADGSLGGPWNHTNAESLIRYTAKKGYTMLGWEFGNELGGRKIKIQIHAAQYAEDVIKLKCLVDQIYQGLPNKPLVIAPASNYEENWFGKDEDLVKKILDPLYLDGASSTFSNLSTLIKRTGTSAVAWVGEAGGAYNGGHHLVSGSACTHSEVRNKDLL